MKRSFWLLSAILSFLIVSCENDAAKHKTMIIGYWSMEKAIRDTRETSLLNDVYFRFEKDGFMLTNLPNTPQEPTAFELKEAVIIQKGNPPIEFNILEITDSILVLSFTMQNTPFEFQLKKTAPPAPSELVPSTLNDSL